MLFSFSNFERTITNNECDNNNNNKHEEEGGSVMYVTRDGVRAGRGGGDGGEHVTNRASLSLFSLVTLKKKRNLVQNKYIYILRCVQYVQQDGKIHPRYNAFRKKTAKRRNKIRKNREAKES